MTSNIHKKAASESPMRRRIFAIVAGGLMLCSPTTVFAGSQTGKITDVLVRASDGLHYFIMTGVATGKPACATKTYWMIKDENSATGKYQLSMLLAAYAANSDVSVQGANACTRWGDGEDVNLLRLR